MNHDHELDKKYACDPRSPYYDDGYRPQVQPKFVRELNPNHLKPREPMRNPNARYKNPNPYKELKDFQNYIFGGETKK